LAEFHEDIFEFPDMPERKWFAF